MFSRVADLLWPLLGKRNWSTGDQQSEGGAGLDKDIVNINENSINYIQSNPKFVLSVEDLAVADTGTTGNYLTLNSPCTNKQKAPHLLPIQITNE